MLLRMAWACVCLVVWPLYYLTLFIRWLIPWPLWPLERVWKADDQLLDAPRNPPYLEWLRG